MSTSSSASPAAAASPRKEARSSGWESATPRKRWVKEELDSFNCRFDPDRVEAKYKEMSGATDTKPADYNPFAFYRGTDHIFWRDLGTSPQLSEFGTEGDQLRTWTWLCGDAHVGNVGIFQDNKGRIVYDLNDFDETVVADYQLDLWRMATSIFLLWETEKRFVENSPDIVVEFLRAYVEMIHQLVATEKDREDVVQEVLAKSSILSDTLNKAGKTKAKDARVAMLNKFTRPGSQGREFLTNNDLIPIQRDSADFKKIKAAVEAYTKTLDADFKYNEDHFKVKAIAERRNQGVGGLGSKRYYILVRGEKDDEDEAILLDFKAQSKPSPYLNIDPECEKVTEHLAKNHPGIRVALGYKALGRHVDDHLGFTELDGAVYGVRERNIYKDDVKAKTAKDLDAAKDLARVWGQVLASAHSRAGDKTKLGYDFAQVLSTKLKGKEKAFYAKTLQRTQEYAKQVGYDADAFKSIRTERQFL